MLTINDHNVFLDENSLHQPNEGRVMRLMREMQYTCQADRRVEPVRAQHERRAQDATISPQAGLREQPLQ